MDVVRRQYSPNVITTLYTANVEGEATIPLLSYRTQRGDAPTVYVCENFACKMPVTTADEVEALLNT